MNKAEAFEQLSAAIRQRREIFARVNLFEDFEHFKGFLDYLRPSIVTELEQAQSVVNLVLTNPSLPFNDRELFAVTKAEEISFLGGNVFEQAATEQAFVQGFAQVESLENQFLILSHQ